MSWYLKQDALLDVVKKLRTGERYFQIVGEGCNHAPVPFSVINLDADRQIVLAAENPTDILLGNYEPGMYLYNGSILVLDVSVSDLAPDCVKSLEEDYVFLLSNCMSSFEQFLQDEVVHPFIDALDGDECRNIARITYRGTIRATARRKLLGGDPYMQSPYDFPFGLSEDAVIRSFFGQEDIGAEMLEALEKDKRNRMEMKGLILCVEDAMKDPVLVEDWEKRLEESMRKSVSHNRQYVTATFRKEDGQEKTCKITPESVLECLIGSDTRSGRYGYSSVKDAHDLPVWYFGPYATPWDVPPVSAIQKIMYGRTMLYEK